MRILVTGSRDWADEEAIQSALEEFYDPFGSVTVVHGACPTGADEMADYAAQVIPGFKAERHPADWSKGRGAGPERNRLMVDLGADLCLAFISNCTSPRCSTHTPHPSHGASGCANLAEAAGIPTRRYYA